MRLTVLLVALLVVAPASAAEPDVDRASGERSDLQIEAGRLGVMMDQGADALVYLSSKNPATQAEPSADAPQQARNAIYAALVSAVLQYNEVLRPACLGDFVDQKLCGDPYLPAWLGKPGPYDDAQLREMTDEASARLTPFWDSICARLEAAGAEKPVCPME